MRENDDNDDNSNANYFVSGRRVYSFNFNLISNAFVRLTVALNQNKRILTQGIARLQIV